MTETPRKPGFAKPGHLGPGQAGLTLLAALLFLVLSYVPLRGVDLWGHLNYGDWVLEHGRLPAEDPFVPLARGMEVVDGSWLAEVVLAAFAGPDGSSLTLVLALTVVVTFALLGRAYRRRARRVGAALLALAGFAAMAWGDLVTLRPESFAVLLFAALLGLVAREEGGRRADGPVASSRFGWVGVAVVFALWANIHPSFWLGWTFLACCLVARALAVAWQRRSLLAPLGDAASRAWIWRLELALLATLANPYGARLAFAPLHRAGRDALGAATGVPPLALNAPGGRELAIAWVALLALIALRGRKLGGRDFLLLATFAAAVGLGASRPIWFAVVLGWVAAPHLGSLFGSASSAPGRRHELLAAGPVWTVAAAVALWIAFALSPASDAMFQRKTGRESPRPFVGVVPLAVTAHLAADPPSGQGFHPREWGDYLARFGPRGLDPFTTSGPRSMPEQVRRDYLRISSAAPGWDRALDRYRVEVVLVDRARQRALGRGLRELEGWRLTHEDREALVFRRRAIERAADGENDAPETVPAEEEASP